MVVFEGYYLVVDYLLTVASMGYLQVALVRFVVAATILMAVWVCLKAIEVVLKVVSLVEMVYMAITVIMVIKAWVASTVSTAAMTALMAKKVKMVKVAKMATVKVTMVRYPCQSAYFE